MLTRTQLVEDTSVETDPVQRSISSIWDCGCSRLPLPWFFNGVQLAYGHRRHGEQLRIHGTHPY